MYKLLVVEDEVWVRKGLVHKIKQLNLGFSWIGEAENGIEALETMEKEHPDLVITDIRMRHMDGIELIRNGISRFPRVRFIIISGFAEFEYAEQAINMGVCGYLLKPIKDRDIEETLKKVLKSLNEGRENEQLRSSSGFLQARHNELVLEKELNRLLLTAEKEQELEPDMCGLPHFDQEKYYMLALVHIDKSSYSQSDFSYQDNELIKYSLRNIASDLADNLGLGLVSANSLADSNQVLLLMMHEKEGAAAEAGSRLVMELYSKSRKYLNLSVTLAASDVEKGLSASLYRKVREVFEMRVIHGENRIFRYDAMKNSRKAALPEHKFRILRKCMELYDFVNIEAILKDVFSQEALRDASSGYIRLAYFETVNTLMGVCSRMGIDPGDAFYNEVVGGQVLDSFEKISDLVAYLNTSIMSALRAGNMCTQECKSLIARAVEYLEQHYAEEVSFRDLAIKLAMNSSYFSTVFKQETGVTITKYLMDLRIRKACELLKQSQLGVADIASCVGYEDSKYFYRVFKKVTGITPLEYRNGE